MIGINCDLCGRVEENLKRAIIEEVELNVCNACSKFGKIVGPARTSYNREQPKKIEPKEEKMELLAENYAEIIKKKRESMGLTQKDFANRISEKESTIHKIETESLEPNMGLAKKLEKALGIKITEERLEEYASLKRKKEIGFTLGDFIKIK